MDQVIKRTEILKKINNFIKPVWKFLNEEITKNKNIGEDLLAKNPAIHPIRKQPRTFTKSVPKGIRLEILLFTYSVNKNLRTAPSPPPKAIYKRLMIVL